MPDLIARMKKQAERTPAGGWIVGFGYQPRQMKDGRTPTIEELDEVSADRPVMIFDSSGHPGAGNPKLFAVAGISADTPDPVGGSFGRKADGKSLAAAYGVANAYGPKADGTLEKLRAARTDLDRRYVNRVRLGGIKFWLDGSLDTAWFTQPYSTNPPGKTGSYSGFRQIPDEVVDTAFDRFWTTDIQIHMHMNGDAAADQALAAIDKAVKKHGMRDARPVFVHASWLRAVTAMAAYQLKEENTKGTLEPGKLADLVILEKNPLKFEPSTIKDIAVVETIKEGRTVFRSAP